MFALVFKYFCVCFGIVDIIFALPDGSNIRQLMQNFQENQDLIASLGTQYEIVYPVQYREDWVRGLSTREVSSTDKVSHLLRTYILIETLHFKFHLDLQLNVNLLAPTLVQTQYSNNSQKFVEKDIENCYYHASVRNQTGSFAALRTCYGLSGVIFLDKEVYLIQPLYGDDSINHPHLLYHYFEETDQRLKCGNKEKNNALSCSGDQLHESDRKSELMGNKYVELAVVLDKDFSEQCDSAGKDPISEAINIVNGADLLYRSINTSLSVVYVEIWKENQVNLSSKIAASVDSLQQYVSTKLTRLSIDAAQLFSGFNFKNAETGIGVPDSICTVNAVGITKVANIFKPHISSLSAAHVLGHNLGMNHDDNKCCHCPTKGECLLSNKIESLHAFFFSSCSIDDYYKTLDKGYGECLFNMPRMRESICGNGILEKEEECDCGSSESCSQSGSCCDPITCKYVKHAECSFGPCCKKCKLLSQDHMCRPSRGECDIPEFCDGLKGECPKDLYKRNGAVCSDGLGYCFMGNCPSIPKQCERLWGRGSDTASNVCYERLNTQGTPYGNCGPDGKEGLLKCLEENALCGTVQCHHGSKEPVVSQKPFKFVVNKINVNGVLHECKVIPTITETDENHGLVIDGTKCGYQKFCVNTSCIRIRKLVAGNCPVSGSEHLPCSGNGICTNINTCFCNDGWSGNDCSKFEGPLEDNDDFKGPHYPVVAAGGTHNENDEDEATLRDGYKRTLVVTIVVTSLLIGMAVVAALFFIFKKR